MGASKQLPSTHNFVKMNGNACAKKIAHYATCGHITSKRIATFDGRNRIDYVLVPGTNKEDKVRFQGCVEGAGEGGIRKCLDVIKQLL